MRSMHALYGRAALDYDLANVFMFLGVFGICPWVCPGKADNKVEWQLMAVGACSRQGQQPKYVCVFWHVVGHVAMKSAKNHDNSACLFLSLARGVP